MILKRASIVCALIVFALMGCGTKTEPTLTKQLKKAEFAAEDYTTIVNPINDLSYALLEKAGEDENVFISSLSLYFALSMVYNGAGGDTQEEIAEVLGNAGISADDLSRANASLIATLEKETDDILFSIANSIWTREDLQLHDDFVTRNEDYFLAEVESVDLTDGATIKKINNWVSKATNGAIQEIMNEPLQPSVVMVLMNAIYFNGAWQYEFPEENTKEDDFYLGDGTKQKVDMMQQEQDFPYMENDLFQSVRLPYGEGEVSMDIYLPKEGVAKEEVVEFLATENIMHENEHYSRTNIDLKLPKFELEYDIELNDILIELGMPTAFSGNEADFSNMFADDMNAFIDVVKQKTYIRVDEKETEAAAVTIVIMEEMAAMKPEEPIKMEVNRPFLFTITDQETETILFIGSMEQPESIIN